MTALTSWTVQDLSKLIGSILQVLRSKPPKVGINSSNLFEPQCWGDKAGDTGAVDMADKGAEDNAEIKQFHFSKMNN